MERSRIERNSNGTLVLTTVCTCAKSLDKECAMCGFGLEIFVPCSTTEGLKLSTEEVSAMRESLYHDCHTPDGDNEDDSDYELSSSGGGKRKWSDCLPPGAGSAGRGRPTREGEEAPPRKRTAKNITPVSRPIANDCKEPRTRISLEFRAMDPQDHEDNRFLSISKPPVREERRCPATDAS
eukprot:CAMPEP_0173434678 /NCGR_PEP_ID=MMETSP1357-20121228/13180_1 /TAXON_ID=77926 /ORGANISM="Hemiselmis rufescens, Strain PCC563" /LENGTH=180 /DNA_ID=CAMNT_0014399561 /DNA_START=355 /DNA_END=894 /DNA_ORIENTATION=+